MNHNQAIFIVGGKACPEQAISLAGKLRSVSAAVDQSPSTRMPVVCAWCQKDMGEKDGQGTTGTSHGICEPCADKLMIQAKNDGRGA